MYVCMYTISYVYVHTWICTYVCSICMYYVRVLMYCMYYVCTYICTHVRLLYAQMFVACMPMFHRLHVIDISPLVYWYGIFCTHALYK